MTIVVRPPREYEVAELVAFANEAGLRSDDLDALVLDTFLDLARIDHVPEHIPVPGMRDRICEAKEEVAYEEALVVNLAGFETQFRYLLEHLAEVRPAVPGEAAAERTESVGRIIGWVEHYRAL